MIKRSFSIFLDRAQVSRLDGFRNRYDSLFSKIPPHITLVFPFESHLTKDRCIAHLKNTIDGVSRFDIRLEDIKLAEDGCLYVMVTKGKSQIERLHDALYSGLLNEFQSKKHFYEPHVTIGRFTDLDQAKTAQEEASQQIAPINLTVDEITIETIADDEQTNVEYIHHLK